MRTAFALAATACFAAQPVLAGERKAKARTDAVDAMANDRLPDDFDLAQIDSVSAEQATPTDPALPRGTDTRTFAWDPPAFEVELNQSGAVLAFGAMGTRHKGMPKLAHVGIDWDF